MNEHSAAAAADTVALTIDGRALRVPRGTTLWEAARRAGIEIPVLCHEPRMAPVGVCRLCVVDVGERVLASACTRPCAEGMQVTTASPAIEGHRRVLLELLCADRPAQTERGDSPGANALLALAERYGVRGGAPRRHPTSGDGPARGSDLSSPVIAVDHAACILCDRCIRACDDLQQNRVIGRTGKGHAAGIAFDLDLPMGRSTCVSCGECVAACPTSALTNKPLEGARPGQARKGAPGPAVPSRSGARAPSAQKVSALAQDGPAAGAALRAVDSLCPYCGVGCAVTYHVDEAANRVAYVAGRDGAANAGRLCVKGRYGIDYATHPQRLTAPLIRLESSYPKRPLSAAVQAGEPGRRKAGGLVNYDDVLPHFREATWDEALALVGRRLGALRDAHGGDALAGLGSAKGSNEEAYLFQKLMRAGLGTNNVDHCTRLCHASSVAALLEGIGSGAVTNVVRDVERADVALVAGSNATENHPVAATFIKQAAMGRTKLLVVNPRRVPLADHAHLFLQISPGSDVAFYNAMLHVIIRDNLVDHAFVEARTENFGALRDTVAEYTPQRAARLCGVPAEDIERAARLFGSAPAAMIFWGMGISQHVHGTDNARCLIALALLTGNVGRPGTGLHPLRGQNNVQGASDAGLIPMMYPDYQPVSDPAARARFERLWGRPLSPTPGLTVTEMLGAALAGRVKGMLIMGENPFISDPNSNKVRKALAALEFLAVQDIFLTETAEFADVILPATSFMEKAGTYTNTDRRVQLGQAALRAPGQARQDWELIREIAGRVGYPMPYTSVAQVFDEFAASGQSYATLSHAALGPRGKWYPCPDPATGEGERIVFAETFPRGRGRFVPAQVTDPAELPSDAYPLVLNTGRTLEHWHTGVMTRRSRALDALQPEAFVEVHPQDAAAHAIADGAWVRLSSRRGEIVLRARVRDATPPGSVFVPMHFREAAANVLTNDAVDPFGKIPEFKFCAVRLDPADGETARTAGGSAGDAGAAG
ncbi:MAG: formate dehydrogenase subunit alpha [Candidatus Lambdaproteobacteria bacterium]|nr:formate dehydrogenase subunit alpha [Candidatus Lambdaproteobacteria bacterium]